MGKSEVAWTDYSWPILSGCQWADDECDLCYAARDASTRLSHNERYSGLAVRVEGQARFTGEVRLHRDKLDQPLRWRTPRLVFVASQSDLFHSAVPTGFIARVVHVMGRAGHHTFQVLTKRPARMRQLCAMWSDRTGDADRSPKGAWGGDAVRAMYESGRAHLFAAMLDDMGEPPEGCAYPPYDWLEGQRFWPTVLPNVWHGTSIGRDRYSFRARIVATTATAVPWLSVEPLLEPLPSLDLTGIAWVVVGGESGPGARPMDPDWVRPIMAECARLGIPFFFKQAGAVLAKRWGMGGAGKELEELPEEFRVRQYPKEAAWRTA